MAGNLQNLGLDELTFGPVKVSYGPKGNTTHFTVTCPTIAPLVAYYNYAVQFGAAGDFLGCDVGSDGVTSAEVKSLEVSYPGLAGTLGGFLSELFFDSWEFLTNEPTDSIFINPLIVGSTGWMTDNDKVVLSYIATNGGRMADAVSECNYRCNSVPQSLPYPATGGTADVPSQYQSPSDPRSKQIFLEIMKGQTEYEKPAYVLRHTSYCSPGALYNSATDGTQQIYTTAQLLTEVGSGWTYNLPPRLYSKISGIPIQMAPTVEAPYYQFGWLKTIAREVQLANFMIEVETEYSLNLWSNLRYAPR